VFVDVHRVVGTLAGSADEKCALDRGLDVDQLTDAASGE